MIATINLCWESLPAQPDLEPNQIHLISASLPDAFDAARVNWSLLTEKERERATRFKFDRHRNRWVFGRLTLKHLLARYLRCEANEIGLRYGEIGKPYIALPENSELMFNYTDSGGYLIYAFSANIEVGVDLEFLPRETNFEALVQRKLTTLESNAFYALPEALHETAFLACWTRKESYGKALGVGIRYSMSDVTLCEDLNNAEYCLLNDGSQVSLQQIQPPFSGIGCLAYIGQGADILGFRLSSS